MLHFGSLLLATVDVVLAIGMAAAALVVGAIVTFFVTRGVLNRISKKKAEQKLDETSKRVEEMLSEARAEGKRIKKESILEAKEQELKRRNEFEQELKIGRAHV